MWILFALLSAGLLGLYDVSKKQSLKDNAVIPVLLINTAICSLIFLPGIISGMFGDVCRTSLTAIPQGSPKDHCMVFIKACIVLGSWICGYFAIKHLPLTIAGPINATRPVMTIIGGLLIFGERLNPWQWCGVITAVLSFYLLSRSGKKEGIDFRRNVWIWLLVAAAVIGAGSGLYDKYLIAGLGMDRMFVQGWYNIYQVFIMLVIFLTIWRPREKSSDSFTWKWSIPLISIFLTAADMVYFYALSLPGAMISIVSMVRRSSVLVSFACGALLFREKNLKGKAADLALVLLSMVFLMIGTL